MKKNYKAFIFLGLLSFITSCQFAAMAGIKAVQDSNKINKKSEEDKKNSVTKK